MRTAEIAGNPGSNPVQSVKDGADAANRDLLSALAGREAGRDRAVAETTRRVVMASLGVMKDQREDRRRSRSLALATFVLVLIGLGPFIWRVADDLIGGEHLSDLATQYSLWACILCPVVLAAVLVAGWTRRRS